MTRHRRSPYFAAVWLAWAAVPIAAQPIEPIRYTVSFPAAQTHYMEVEAAFPTGGQPQIDLMMPVWTPGSYLVREFSRNVEALVASDDRLASLPVEKTRKNRWRVRTNGARTVSVRYRVYAHEMSARTNWVDDQFALINGAQTFMTLLASLDRPYEVRLQLPAGWSRSLSGMDVGPQPHTFRAADYDTLVDSPIVAGNPIVYEFIVAGKPHYLVNIGEEGVWDGARAVQDLVKIVQKTAEFWGTVPYDRYFFFNIIAGPNLGLEHKSSTVLNTPRESTGTRRAYLGWLRMASHEYFHAWNVKRLRPIELGPFDYENEVYTKGLWFAEGVTDYYADLQNARAGVSTVDEFLAALSTTIANLQATPGRLVQPVELASYDAWIKYYRPDENSINVSISYYIKGAVIGFLLDANIRRLTAGGKSLDDLMRVMYQRFSGAKGFTSEDLRATAIELVGPLVGQELRGWLARTLETTDELDYGEALDWFGLQFQPAPEPRMASLGVRVRTENQRTIVSEVLRGSPASAAGILLGDEIVAINDVRVVPGQLADQMGKRGAGSRASFTISRRGAPQRIDVALAADSAQAWLMAARPETRADQRARLRAWLQN
ncbi:MAG: M61 family peptidase [Acidobacteria bacterium]|nr:M61 family peptidase [Acidobacteriota bacterium]